MTDAGARNIRAVLPYPTAPVVSVYSPTGVAYMKVDPNAATLKLVMRPRTVTQSLVYAATIVHKIADGTTIAATKPAVTDANTRALVAELKADHNVHVAATTYHDAAGTQVATADATDEATTVALVNAMTAAMAAHYASATEHGGMTDTINLAVIAGSGADCTNYATALTKLNIIYPAHVAHLLVTDLGAYITAGAVGLPIEWPCLGSVYVKTDTSGGVFTVADFRA